jgi:superfamily II DNA helicase RecQ
LYVLIGRGEVLAALRSGQTDVLLISPERLSNPSFAAQLPSSDVALGD